MPEHADLSLPSVEDEFQYYNTMLVNTAIYYDILSARTQKHRVPRLKTLHQRFMQRVVLMKRAHQELRCGDSTGYSHDKGSTERIQNHAIPHFAGSRILLETALTAQTTDGLKSAERKKIRERAERESRMLLHLWNEVTASSFARDTIAPRDGRFVTCDTLPNDSGAVSATRDFDHARKAVTGCMNDAADLALRPVLSDSTNSKKVRSRLSRKLAKVKSLAADITPPYLAGTNADFRKILLFSERLMDLTRDLRSLVKPLRPGVNKEVIRGTANLQNAAEMLDVSHSAFQRNIRRLYSQTSGTTSSSVLDANQVDPGMILEFEGNWLETNIADGTTGRVVLKGELTATSIPGFYTLNAIDRLGGVGLWGEWTGAAFPNPIPLTDNAISSVEFVTAGGISTLTIAFAPPSDNNPPVINGAVDNPLSGIPSFSIPPIVYTFDTSQRNTEMTFVGATTASSAVNFGAVQLLLNGKGFLKIVKA